MFQRRDYMARRHFIGPTVGWTKTRGRFIALGVGVAYFSSSHNLHASWCQALFYSGTPIHLYKLQHCAASLEQAGRSDQLMLVVQKTQSPMAQPHLLATSSRTHNHQSFPCKNGSLKVLPAIKTSSHTCRPDTHTTKTSARWLSYKSS